MESTIKNILGIEVDLKDIKNPYELYRKMRPYYFSDSRIVRKMTPEMFDLAMNKLSTNMKQDMFEDMTRQMVCQLITPNLIPQTGPTGGGDGKTDIETYSVSDEISEKWYMADTCKGNEKWAFAISCKLDWKPKIESDVKKIVNTKRGFTKIYFCTNQAVSSKNKADLYDKYKATYNIDTTILDINWYKQSVFENGCYNIAINSLNLSNQLFEEHIEGPLDKSKKEELAVIDERIANNTIGKYLDTSYIDDLLTAAILSRELELSKPIVDGRFSTALEQARKHGTSQQVFNIIYQRGWTEFYWNKNSEEMYQQYIILKKMLDKEVNAVRIEKAYILHNLIKISIDCKLFRSNPDLQLEDEYWQHLRDTLSNDETHQASYLYVKICLLETKLFNLLDNPKADINDTLIQLRDSLKESSQHLDIPFETHAAILNQVGIRIHNNSVFEEIVDMLSDIESKRKCEITAAEVHFDRGAQNLEQGDFKTAIKHLGQCIVAYQKEPTKSNLIQASGMLASAYQGIDLLYSAKVFYVKALSLLFHKIEVEGDIDHIIIIILFELCRIELKLGQINSFLNWLHMLDKLVNANPSFNDESYKQKRLELDAVLATILLSSKEDTENWGVLPSILENMGFSVSKDASLYALGYEEELSQEFKDIIMKETDWRERILKMPKSEFSLFHPHFINKYESQIQTLINGCKILATFRSDMRVQAYAELFLAFIESFLATMSHTDMAIATPVVNLKFKAKSGGNTEVKNNGRSTDYVVKINLSTVTEKKIWELCFHFLALFMTRNAITNDFQELLNRKEQEEKLGERLAGMGTHYQEFKNCYILEYKNNINQWVNKESKIYPPKNEEEHAAQSIDENTGKQATQIITDLIDYPLWDKAKWSGCGYMVASDGSQPPILLFLYRHYSYAKQIFEKWESDFRNKKLNLKLSFITGVNTDHPKWYKVIIAPDMKKIMELEKNKSSRYVVTCSRFHLMQSTDDTNLKMFSEFFGRFNYAGITASEIENNQISTDPDKRYPRIIPITNVEFREAWTIGENDPNSMAILPDDKPIIPKGKEQDAPVLKLIESKNKRHGKIQCVP